MTRSLAFCDECREEAEVIGLLEIQKNRRTGRDSWLAQSSNYDLGRAPMKSRNDGVSDW